MNHAHDLASLTWTLTGYTPYLWKFDHAPGIGETSQADVLSVRARVPGSVQRTLLDEGLLPDWNLGMNARDCEWAENRHWIYSTRIPRDWLVNLESDARVRLVCDGLDYSGWILVEREEVGEFQGSLTPHEFDLTGALSAHDDECGVRLEIVFDCPPRWLGQFGYTPLMTEWKPRYNYTWDWISRAVQIGIWDGIRLEISGAPRLGDVYIGTDYDVERETGILSVTCQSPDETGLAVRVELDGIRDERYDLTPGENGILWSDLDVRPWWPNGFGEPELHDLTVTLIGADGVEHDRLERRVGFKHVEWRQCEDAPADADPWICVVNGEPVFLQGVNWTPILPNFADAADREYDTRLDTYQDMGCTILRVWGGGFLEKHVFYDGCDERGLLVWQEFPLSSSGLDNRPPSDDVSIDELAEIAASYIRRRRHHASLLLWCGGNELTGLLDDGSGGMGPPAGMEYPLLQRFAEIVDKLDPGRRFVATSSSGPRFTAEEEDLGKGVHWDVHGPWKLSGTMAEWEDYWSRDDALFRSEVGSPGCSSVEIIERYKGEEISFPAVHANPLWRRTGWWIEWQAFVEEHDGREPDGLKEYVDWSRRRQAEALRIAATACRARFPRCGGFILWMGHDSFPCTANTAILDFHGEMKPAAHALAEVFLSDAESLR